MEGFYLVSWETLQGAGLSFDTVYALIDDVNIVEDDNGTGVWFRQSNFPDVVPENGNGIPDFLETGPGTDTTASQGIIHG